MASQQHGDKNTNTKAWKPGNKDKKDMIIVATRTQAPGCDQRLDKCKHEQVQEFKHKRMEERGWVEDDEQVEGNEQLEGNERVDNNEWGEDKWVDDDEWGEDDKRVDDNEQADNDEWADDNEWVDNNEWADNNKQADNNERVDDEHGQGEEDKQELGWAVGDGRSALSPHPPAAPLLPCPLPLPWVTTG
ncbi:unnamed protein product [Cyclocybe aegerita]|uniref:Uncharacterized protein n=1 Tax=Cyclocybe aegerita TaxID=1973307 RepID=A0A8S0WTE9_CYCAE|nr:unnamed protein product [Cyclocybe aegerita]